jgi:uncharacterized membrane protein YagU involved in acid resistance
MNRASALLWGFVGTVVLTGTMSAAQGLGLSRMGLPYLLGTMVTDDRDRAKLVGFGLHLLNGWLFAFVYAAAFESWRRATWWLGAAIGLVHAGFVLVTGMGILPSLHPRMASELAGPTPTRQLEPPGFLALNYGRRTPLSVLLAHVVYGAILGAFYQPRHAGQNSAAGDAGGRLAAAARRLLERRSLRPAH